MKNHSEEKRMPRSRRRTKQVANAQNAFRNRKREAGCQRIQEWVTEETLIRLGTIARGAGISRAALLEVLVAAAFTGEIDLGKLP